MLGGGGFCRQSQGKIPAQASAGVHPIVATQSQLQSSREQACLSAGDCNYAKTGSCSSADKDRPWNSSPSLNGFMVERKQLGSTGLSENSFLFQLPQLSC